MPGPVEYYRLWRVVLPLVFTIISFILLYTWVEVRLVFWLFSALIVLLYIRWIKYWWTYDNKNPTLKK